MDGYVTVDSFYAQVNAVPVYKVGSSDYYFAVTKNRPDLLNDLNLAMSRIQDENRFFNTQMYEEIHAKVQGPMPFLTNDEKKVALRPMGLYGSVIRTSIWHFAMRMMKPES